MNGKQKTVLMFCSVPIVGMIAGRLHVAIMFGAWGIFFRGMARRVPFFIVLVIVAVALVFVFRDKRPKVAIKCPKCGRALYGATPQMSGETGVCPKCKAEFVIGQVDEDKKAAVDCDLVE